MSKIILLQIDTNNWSQMFMVILLCIILLQYWKYLPFMYHIRSFFTMWYTTWFNKGLKTPSEAIITSSRVWLSDLAWLKHLNNPC